MFFKRFVLLLFMVSLGSFSQSNKMKELEHQVKVYNDSLKYEKSIALLSNVINDSKSSDFEKYYAYLLKSFTYKRVFNYPKALHYLDMALEIGLKTDQKELVKNTILAEKCFIYFDTQDFKKSELLLEQLKGLNYKHLTVPTKCWIIMQDGYIKMLDKKYKESEQILDRAIELVASDSPENLPNIYGKKIELYNKMGLFDQRDYAFKEGLRLAKKYNKVKYEMYLYQVMRNIFQENKDFENAFYTQKKYDSIVKFYDAVDSNGKLELAEKKLEDENRKLKEENTKYIDYILYGVIVSLVLLLYFIIRLYLSNKARRLLAEKENQRIHEEIERLSQSIDEKGNAALNLNDFNLTERQIMIIDLIKKGNSNKEIANLLHISENTVKYHLKVIYEILDIEHRNEIR